VNELILLVEDNAMNLKLARDVLRFHGFRTIDAATGAGGIAVAEEQRPDVILMDIHLPDMDGVAALSRLRLRPITATIPVVALTALAMDADRERLKAAGFDGYLVKPIDIKRFPEQVRSYCRLP
jgi:two-component system, cell cycle response regulator DivK